MEGTSEAVDFLCVSALYSRIECLALYRTWFGGYVFATGEKLIWKLII